MTDTSHDAPERTGFRASLSAEYAAGHAPANQHRDLQPPPNQSSYFGMPAIKKPEWTWCVPAYFFIGGTASGADIAATPADKLGRPGGPAQPLARRLIAPVAALPGFALPVAGPRRPAPFRHILRGLHPPSLTS